MNFENCEELEFLPSLISLVDKCDKIQDKTKNIRKGINLLELYPIEDVETLLKYFMPKILQIIEMVFNENNAMVQTNIGNAVFEKVKANLQVSLDLLDISNQALKYIMKHDTVSFVNIPSVPLNMALILNTTFKHCKNSQKHQSFIKSMTTEEMLNLFRKAQEVHTNFLNFLDTCLCFNENEADILIKLLDLLLKISEILSGVNIKSMADNWKGFLTLTQKYSNFLCDNKSVNVTSLAIKNLTEEIDKSLQEIYQQNSIDLKKSTQLLKVAGFLIKVVLKLLQMESNLLANWDVLIEFCFTIYSWHYGCFITNKIPEAFANEIDNMLYASIESLINQLMYESVCVEKLCSLHESSTNSKHSFGVLNLLNDFLRKLPGILKSDPDIIENSQFVTLLNVIFSCIHNCYREYFYDYNSFFYEELIVNISVAVLLFPSNYCQVEKLLLEYILQDKIWPALIATEVWSLLLRFSPESLRQLTLIKLIGKIQELNLGIFAPTPATIHMKILVQRIFKLLPLKAVIEIVSELTPMGNVRIWNILCFKNIHLSQRFFVELVLNDIFDKINSLEKQECPSSDVILLAESMDIISYTSFNELQINTSNLISSLMYLWSLNINALSPFNDFTKYFIQGLIKLSIALATNLTGEQVLLILNQLKQLLNETTCQLLTCDFLHSIAVRNFNNYRQKLSLYSTITDIFEILLAHKNAITIQISLETFRCISENNNYEIIVNKVSKTQSSQEILANFMNKIASGAGYNSDYLENIQNSEFKHRCLEWLDLGLPRTKKIKLDREVDDVIAVLKEDARKLTTVANRTQLNSRQIGNIKDIVTSLETFVNQH